MRNKNKFYLILSFFFFFSFVVITNKNKLTIDDIRGGLKISNVVFSEEQINTMLSYVERNRRGYEEMREIKLEQNRLHEVVRLSGMNIPIGDDDRPLIIKVASIPNAKLQVYFIDNEDYFKRKTIFNNKNGKSK